MKVIDEKIVMRDGVRVRVREYADGAVEESLADLATSGQEPVAETRNISEAKDAQTGVANQPSDSWLAKTARPIGMRDDGVMFTREEGAAVRKMLADDKEQGG